MTVTTPASAFDYLTDVANGQTKAAGLKRPTVAALQQAAKALGLSDRIDHAPYGYHVGKGWDVSPCPNLKSAASALLAALARAPYAAAPAPVVGPLLPGEVAAPAAPAPAAPAPELPQFVTYSQQQQQPQQGREYRSPARGGRVAWDEPGESAAALAPRAARIVWGAASEAVRSGEATPALLEKVAAEITCRPPAAPAAPAPAAPARVVAPGPLARKSAPARLPADVAALLQRFSLSMESLLTVGASNAKLAKGAALAWPVILHHLPARSLAAALLGPEAGTTAPRSRLPGLADLAKATGTLALGMAHNGCPWASKGCADGCLAWSGHGGMGTVPAAARARRTLAYLADSPAYARAILWAIAKAYRQAQDKGLPLAVRLRGTDDLAWHLQRVTVSPTEAVSLARRYGLPVAPGQGQTLAETLSLAPAGSIHLYEYSKAPVDGPLGLQAQRSAGWDVTASLAADRPDGALAAIRAVEAGFRLAVPVALPKGAALPAVLILERGPLAVDLACIPGDDTDHRWSDPSGPHLGCDGVAVILRTKVSRGRGPAAEGFSLQPVMDTWQPLAGGGRAMLRSRPWGQG